VLISPMLLGAFQPPRSAPCEPATVWRSAQDDDFVASWRGKKQRQVSSYGTMSWASLPNLRDTPRFSLCPAPLLVNTSTAYSVHFNFRKNKAPVFERSAVLVSTESRSTVKMIARVVSRF
jgi:hypothetical protein